ncbi:MAG: methyl-accepting chemotaxis protein [Pantoea sp.]|nr:methyl-accepting chemotaxis protein [Pantoea sp.]
MSGLAALIAGFNNWSVGKKLTSGFILVLLIMVGIAGAGIKGFANIQADAQKQQIVVNMVQALNQARLNRTLYQYTGDSRYGDENAQALQQLQQLGQSLYQFSWHSAGQEKLDTVKQATDHYLAQRKTFVAALNQRSALLKEMNISTLADYSHRSEALSSQVGSDAGVVLAASRLDAAIQHALKAWPDFVAKPDETHKANIVNKLSAVTERAELLNNLQSGGEAGWIAALKLDTARLAASLSHYQTTSAHQESESKALTASAGKLNEAVKKLYETQMVNVTDTITQANVIMYSSTLLGVLAGLIIAWRITRNITQPLRETLQIANQIAAGDLTAHIATQRGDEPGLLMQAVGRMNQNLKEIIVQVREGVDNVARASAEIAAGNIDLSSRTEQQSAAVVETAASMEQLTSTVKQNAENAHQASSLAEEASLNAGRGGKIVQDVVVTMEEISTSSRKIADIISVINGIAFQTNILALNAAVEAARAGEQGRGFAVVAGEVRNLAQRSATAAREIETLISQAGDKVNNGSRLVSSAGQAMEDIVRSVSQVSSIMHEIAHASEEQSRGILQIGQAMTEMDTTTQQNAALVEESSAAASSLEEQAKQLEQTVAVFKTAAQSQAMRSVAAQTPRYVAAPKAQIAPAAAGGWEQF